MGEMSNSELLANVNAAKDDAVNQQGDYISINEKLLKTYLGDPYGDEQEGQSQVISVDVQDVIESDMPSLVRVFLGSQDVMKFIPRTDRDSSEAEEKTKYINWIIRNQKGNSFKILHDWMKDAEIQKTGVVKVEYVEEEKKSTLEVDGLDDDEVLEVIADFEQDPTVEFEILGQDKDDDGTYLKIEYKQEDKYFQVRNIETEDYLISRNARSKEDAELVGDKSLLTRGELISLGFDEDLVKSLPGDDEKEDQSALPQIRYQDQGGEQEENEVNHWASAKIEVFDLYIKIDFDGDGIAERRRIIMAGNRILENEPFEVVPYAMMSAVLMPHNAIGRSRAELTQQTQRVKTVLFRQMLDNGYRVTGGRVVVNEEKTNIDDLLTQRPNGIVRTKDDPRMAVAQLETPYIGQETMQILQYVDSTRVQSTGHYLTNQALDSDQLHKETATRFEGIKDAGAAKVELVARVYAETGYRELYEVLGWLVSKFQRKKDEITVLGKQLTVDPRRWRHTHYVESNVGLAAGDNQETLKNLGTMYTIQNQLKAEGSILVDETDRYNLLQKMGQLMELNGFQTMFNNPEVPEEILAATVEQLIPQNEMLMDQIDQLSSQKELVEMERVKQQTDLLKAQNQSEFNYDKLKADMTEHFDEMMFKYTELEVENKVDIPTKGVNG